MLCLDYSVMPVAVQMYGGPVPEHLSMGRANIGWTTTNLVVIAGVGHPNFIGVVGSKVKRVNPSIALWLLFRA